jgi:hypothetical protein
VRRLAGAVSRPALVLDIDETSLSNWANFKANNFGFIADGACEGSNSRGIAASASRPVVAQSGLGQTCARLSAFGPQRTNMLAWLRPHRS